MARKPEEYRSLLTKLLNEFDKHGAAQLCEELIVQLYEGGEPFPPKEGEGILQLLRNKRMFVLMQRVAEALLQTGNGTFKVRRQYAQALIDQSILTAAEAVLEKLRADLEKKIEEAKSELTEARGLLGRLYKQHYVSARSVGQAAQSAPTEAESRVLQKAVRTYHEVYEEDRGEHLWHGINTVALMARARRDGVKVTVDPAVEAEAVLRVVQERHDNQAARAWDYATAVEASVALGRTEEALEWAQWYIKAPYADAFEIGSTLRQLTEVWQVDAHTEVGKMVIPVLQTALLAREGGQVTMAMGELRQQVEDKSKPEVKNAFEKVFGPDSFNTYKWYMKGVDRCQGIARLGRDSSQGHGTGFLLKGSELDPRLGDDPVVITNAHVLSDDLSVDGALRADETCIIFEALTGQEEVFKVGKIIWSSRPTELDVTVVKFDEDELERVRAITQKVKPFPISAALPIMGANTNNRVYIIGHPGGGTLQISLQDNLLLGHQSPLLHYRTPTIGGSSGSPVFNRNWELIGVHHKGGVLAKLNGEDGQYEANEGIHIKKIIEAIRAELNV